MMWLVLWRLWKSMMSTGIWSRRRFMNFCTFSEGKAFWVLSAETPMLSRKLRHTRVLERLVVRQGSNARRTASRGPRTATQEEAQVRTNYSAKGHVQRTSSDLTTSILAEDSQRGILCNMIVLRRARLWGQG